MSLSLIFIFVSSAIFIFLIIKYSKKLSLLDEPNNRSSHTTITPRGAGIGMGISFFITILFFYQSLFLDNWYIFVSILFVFIVGVLDDYKDTSPKMKFYVIFISSFLLYLNDIAIYSLGDYFGFNLNLGFFAVIFTMFALAGFTNALNLIDGLDGLAGSISTIILTIFLYIGYINSDYLIITLSLLTIASILSFLIFNWYPAKIFMGDSGSLFLGFMISLVAVLSLEYIHPISIFYLAAIPILDTLVVMTRRIREKKPAFAPDKTHIHHILLDFFSGNVKRTVKFLSLMQILFTLVGLNLALDSAVGDGAKSTVALLGFVLVFILFYYIFTGIHRRQIIIDKFRKRKGRFR